MNKVFLIGNLTKDPEHSSIPSGIKVCKFTVAVNRSYSNTDGNRQADFLPIVCWRSQAENCAKFLKKGSKVGICGSIQTRSYDASDGTKRYVTEIVADEVQFLSGRGAEADDGGIQDLPGDVKERFGDSRQVIDDGSLPF